MPERRTCDGTLSKFLPSIRLMCLRACDVIWCLSRKEKWQPSRMQWKWLLTWLYLHPAKRQGGVNDPAAESFIFGLFGARAQHEPVASTTRSYEKQSGHFFFCNKRGVEFLGVLDCTCGRNIRSVQCHTEPVRLLCTRPVELFYYTDMLYSIRNLHK